jgi:hypothetical protein
MRFVFFNSLQGLGMFLLFAGPLFMIALLFGVNWKWHTDLRGSR